MTTKNKNHLSDKKSTIKSKGPHSNQRSQLAEEMAFLYRMTQAFSSSLDLDYVVNRVLHEVCELLNVAAS